jgi:hypothetical protein
MGPFIASLRAAHDFGIEGWEPDKTEKLPEPEIANPAATGTSM